MRRDKRKGEKEGKGERKKRRGKKKECKRKQRRRGGKRKGGEKKKEREKRKIMRRKKVVMRDLNPHPSRVYSHYPQEDSQMCLCGISLQQDRIGHEGKPYSVTVAVANEAITHVLIRYICMLPTFSTFSNTTVLCTPISPTVDS